MTMAGNAYEQYYMRQAQGGGSGLPIFRGVGVQRGYGLGNLLNAAVRMLVPGLSGKALLKQGLSTGANILRDVLGGRSLKQSAKERGAALVGQAMARAGFVPPARKKRKKGVRVQKRPVRRRRPQSGRGTGPARRRRKRGAKIRCVKRRRGSNQPSVGAGDIFS